MKCKGKNALYSRMYEKITLKFVFRQWKDDVEKSELTFCLSMVETFLNKINWSYVEGKSSCTKNRTRKSERPVKVARKILNKKAQGIPKKKFDLHCCFLL